MHLATHLGLTRAPGRRSALALLAGWPWVARGAGSAPRLRVRFAHVVAEEAPKGLAALRFKVLVEQRSEGRIAVDVHPAARLYGDVDEIEAVRLGAVELIAPSLSKFGRLGLPEFELFDLPYLFEDIGAVRRLTEGAMGRELLGLLARQELVGLGYMDNGFKHMSATRALRQPADYAGLRMRVQASRAISAQMRALGARPVALPFSETRRALAAGVVDGTENPLSNFWTQRMHEVQPHLSLTQHGYLGYAVVSSQRFWGALRTPDRDLLQQALAEALAFGNLVAEREDARALQAVLAAGRTTVHRPSIDERAQLRRALAPVAESMAGRIGADWLHRARRVVGA